MFWIRKNKECTHEWSLWSDPEDHDESYSFKSYMGTTYRIIKVSRQTRRCKLCNKVEINSQANFFGVGED